MQLSKRCVRALNETRGTLLGDHVRVAESGLSRIVGLLGEPGLASGDGLLIQPSQGVHTWGMRFPIDVVVLDDDWKVLDLRPAMGPFKMTRVYLKAAAVLELPAGMIGSSGTRTGDSLDFIRNQA